MVTVFSNNYIQVYAHDTGVVENNEKGSSELKKSLETVEQYIDMDGDKKFDESLAREDNASKDTIETGRIYNEMVRLENQGEHDALVEQRRSWISEATKYGNWCGKGDKGAPPIDLLDRQCQKYDKCYAANGWGNTQCDINFVHNIGRNFDSIKNISAYAKNYAKAAVLLFAGKVGGTQALAEKFPALAPYLP